MIDIPRLRVSRAASHQGSLYRNARAALYDPLMAPLEAAVFGELRARQLQDVRGLGLEVGIGTGLSLRHYPPGARVIGLEPMAEMAAHLIPRSVPQALLAVVRAECENLPFADSSFDFVVGQFVLCSVTKPSLSVSEFHRVLKRGGALRLLEHVRSCHDSFARVQDSLAPAWARFAFGCRLNGQPSEVLLDSAFKSLVIEPRWLGTIESIWAIA
jgi:ubiquinone/menaquinone biosynthesis C-methylase UbiE